MDTISMMDDDPTLPIDFDQSTNLLNFLPKEKMDNIDSRRESLFSLEESSSEAAIKSDQVNGQNTPDRGTLREHEEIISTFKKENFGLKLRIYYLEERLQMAYEEDTENILKTNIELKVSIEQLKKEVTEKQQLLIKASKAIETITTESERHIVKIKSEFTKQYDEMVDELQQEVKIKDEKLKDKEKVIENLNQEFKKAEEAKVKWEEKLKEASTNPENMEEMISKYRKTEEDHEKKIKEKDLKIKDLEEQLKQTNDFRKSNEDAEDEIKALKDEVDEKEDKIQNLKEELRELASQSLDRSNAHYEILYNKLEAQNAENENKIKELNKELAKKSSLVEELKDYINKTERVNKELRNGIHDKETEKHRSSISLQEHIRWKLNNRLRDLLASVRLDLALSNKEKEVNRCYAQIEQLEESLEKSKKDLALKDNVGEEKDKASQEKLEVIAALKAELQEKEIFLKKFKQALEDKDKELIYVNNSKLRVEQDLDKVIAQKNLELQTINEQLKDLGQAKENKLKLLEGQCQKIQEDSQLQLNRKDKLIEGLSNALRNKDLLIEDLLTQPEPSDFGSETPRDFNSMVKLLSKLRTKLKDMDQKLEADLEEKFKSIDAKDKEILELKSNLRDKDRELELAKANVTACEGVIKHLESTNKEKDNTMRDLKGALEVQENSFKISSETAAKELEECQANLLKLTKLLDVKEEEIKELQKSVLKSGTNLDEKSIETIFEQLNARHKINQELASERDAAINRNEMNKQKFISALNAKDAQIREAFLRMSRLSDEKNEEIKKLKAFSEQKSEELRVLEKKLLESQSEMDAIKLRHQFLENDKDHKIENLAKSGLEKDRIIGELQERINLKSREDDHALYEEMGILKEKLRKSIEDLEKKSDQMSELKSDNKHLQEKLNDLKRSENIEITMKFDNLRSELDDKERKLKDARDEISRIQQEMKQVAIDADALQKNFNSLQKENVAQNVEIEELKWQSKEKDSVIKQLQEKVNEYKGLSDKLHKLKDEKSALKVQLAAVQADAESLNSVKDAMEKKLREADLATVGLEKKLEENQRDIESMMVEKEDLKRENQELKFELDRSSLVPKRDHTSVGASIDEVDSKDLREVLQSQIEEQKKLLEATEKEKSHFLKLIQDLQSNARSLQNSSMNLELQSVSTLKSQYEDGIRQNDALQQLLEEEVKSLRESNMRSSTIPTTLQNEIADLKRRLEESENWNRSLQSRLNELLPRVGGVGAPFDDVVRTNSVHSNDDATDRLMKEHEDMMRNLHQKELELKILSNNNEQGKRVIKELEETVASLRQEVQHLKDAKEEESSDLQKQIDGMNGVNDVLRKTLNEKIEELEKMKDNARFAAAQADSDSLRSVKDATEGRLMEAESTIVGLKKKLEQNKWDIETTMRQKEDLKRDNQELKLELERSRLMPKGGQKPVGASVDEVESKDLREVLRSQIEEQKKLLEATEKEKSHFLKLIQDFQSNARSLNIHEGNLKSYHLSSSRNSSMNLELQSVSTLKSQYEDGIRQNDALQQLFENEIKSRRESNTRSSTIPTTLQNEIADLKRKLEESENWNRSLQSRLNELLPHVGGVGAPFDDVLRTNSVHNNDDTAEKLNKENEAMIRNSYQKQLEGKSKELEATMKSLADLKAQFDKFSLMKNIEVETLSTSCEQAKRRIKELEETVSSMRDEVQHLKDAKEEESHDLQKQIDGMNDVNDVLRKTLTEKVEELEKMKDNKQKATIENAYKKHLEEKSEELATALKNLTDLKAHYEKFSLLKDQEIETLSNTCEQAKRVIKELEETVASLRYEVQHLRDAKDKESGDLQRQIDGINGVNDTLRKTLNEKVEELKQVKENAMHQEEHYRKVEKASRSLLEDKALLMSQMQKKSDQVTGLKKEIDSLTFELERSKENHSKKIGECETLQKGRQELRNLNERLRRTLGDVSKTCESNEQNMFSFKLELEKSEIAIEQQRRENEQLNAVNKRLRDEIKGMQESAHEMQRLADELKDSQHVNKALQKQLNEISQSKSSFQPDVDKLRGQVTDLQRSNSAFEEKMRFYERQASALQAEYREEKSTFERGKDYLRNEIEALKKEVGDLNRVKTDLESKVKGLFYESESYKSMIERLEEDNRSKQNVVHNLESKLHRQRDLINHSTSMTPQKTINMLSQTSPNRFMAELDSVGNKENTMKEAIQKRDVYIEALKKQLEFYKEEKDRFETERKKTSEESSNSNNDLIALHISEMRELRMELEQSISNNNALRDHLEHRLSEAEKEAEKIKDPNVRATLLRENDSLRAKISEYDIRIKEVKTINDRLRKEGQRSSGVILDKDNQIKELKIMLERKYIETERMQLFAPQETSSTVTSPIQTTKRFTQTTPTKYVLTFHKEVQVDTIVAKSQTEMQQLGEKLRSAERVLKEKDTVIAELKLRSEREKQEVYCNAMNMKSEIIDLKTSIEKKDLVIGNLEMKVIELEGTISSRETLKDNELERKASNEELVALHISEMQKLKKELELSIKNNDELRSQLEHRLLMIEKDAAKIKDPKFRANIIRDNDLLRSQSIDRQNAVSRMQVAIDQLVAEKKSDKECIKKLHLQIHNLNKTTENLKEELSLYDRLQQQLSQTTARSQTKSKSPEATVSGNEDPKFDASLLQLLLEEIRNLRVQLQKSIDTNMALKEKLEEQLGMSFNTSGFSSPAANSKHVLDAEKGNTVRRALFSSLGESGSRTFEGPGKIKQQMLAQEAPTKENGSPGSRSYALSPNSLATVVDDAANKNLFVRGKLEDFVVLKNKISSSLQRIIVLHDVHLILQKQKQMTGKQMQELQEEVGRISVDLKDCHRLVNTIWIDENAKQDESSDGSIVLENQQLRTELNNLKSRLINQEKLLKTSLQRLEESNRVKENLEQQILSKLKTTHGTIVKASQNLKDKIDKSKTPPKKLR